MVCKCALCEWERDLPEDFRRWSRITSPEIDIYPVTASGTPRSKVIGYICGKCLHGACNMRNYIKASRAGVRITKHALDRFDERNPGETMNDESKTAALLKMFQQAKRIRFRPKFTLQRRVNNGNKAAEYWFKTGWFFVTTTEEPRTILTVERAFGRKLNQDFWFIEEETT